MTRICRYLPLFLLLMCLQVASAQSRFDLNLGFGYAHDKATGQGIEGDYSGPNSINFSGTCTVGVASDPTCAKTPALGNFMMGIGGDLMLWKHLGLGADVSFMPAKLTYGSFQAVSSGGVIFQPPYQDQIRTTFYGFNAILEPVTSKKAILQLHGGIGGANVKFYQNQVISGSLIGSSNASQYFGSSNHFQIPFGAGVQIFVTDHWYVRPEFVAHFVPNFAQFGSNLVMSGMVWVGYSFGDH